MKAKQRKHGLLWLPLVFALFMGVDFYLSNNVISLEREELYSSRLPMVFDGFTVVHLSDVHAKRFGENNSDLISAVKKAAPDIIVITGDFIERIAELEYAEELFSGLMSIAPVYYTTGNHEWGAEWTAVRTGKRRLMPELRALMNKCGVIYMDNRAVKLRRGQETIWLAGLCDPNGPADSKSISELLAEPRIDGDPFIMLMSHRYDMYDEYIKAGADVTFAGHAHGGAIRLPFTDGLIGPGLNLWPKHTSGVYTEDTGKAYKAAVVVSRGLGDTVVPRLFNRPQVLALVLHTDGTPR